MNIMKISLKKLSQEKFEVTITNGTDVLFNDQRFYNYMGEDMVTISSINETINQLSQLFGTFDEVENDFDI